MIIWYFYKLGIFHLSFSQKHNVDNVDIIANFVFPYNCSFLLYLYPLLLVNVKLELRDTWGLHDIFHGTVKQTWQYWDSCIVESL